MTRYGFVILPIAYLHTVTAGAFFAMRHCSVFSGRKFLNFAAVTDLLLCNEVKINRYTE